MWNRKSNQNENVHFNICTMLIICTLLLVEICLGDSETQKAFLNAQTIYDGWNANYGSIKSMKFKCLNQLVNAEETNSQKYVRYSYTDKIEDGKRVYVRHTDNPAGFENEDKVSIISFDGDIGMQYLPSLKRGEIYRGLKGKVPEISNNMKDYLFSDNINLDLYTTNSNVDNPFLKLIDRLKKEYPDGIPSLTFHFIIGSELGKIRVLPDLKSVAGEMCHVLEIHNPQKGSFCKYWFAHDKNMLPMGYISYRENKVYAKREVQKVASVETDIGTVWYPSLATLEINTNNDGKLQYGFTVDEFIPHIKTTRDMFKIDFPDGTNMFDSIANIEYIVGEELKVRNER